MNSRGLKRSFLILSAVAIAFVAPARADLIPVANPSFENATSPPLTTPGQYTTYPGPGNTIPDWSNAPSAGVQYYVTPANSGGGYQYTSLDGVQGAYSDSALITQTLSFALEPGTYTLTIASGWRGGRNYAGGNFGLYTTDNTDLGSMNTVQPGTQETFTDNILTVVVPSSSPELGQDVVIKMIGLGQDGGTIDFDNVRLTFVAPEPSTYLLMGLGMVILIATARRRIRA